jgi:chromosome segregation ATPase
MAGEQTVNGKTEPKKPVSVKETTVPRIKKVVGGELGEALCEGLIQNERTTTTMVEALRQETSDMVAGVAEETSSQVRDLRTDTFAAKGAVAEVRKQFGDKANRSEVTALEGRVETVEGSMERVNMELEASLEAMSRDVEVPTAEGGIEKRKMKGKELMDHTFGEIQGIKDTLNGVTEQISQMDSSSVELQEARAMLERAQEIVAEAQQAREEDNQSISEQLDEVRRTSHVPPPAATTDNDELRKVKTVIHRASEKVKQLVEEMGGLKASVAEAFSNVDGKIQLIAVLALGDAYEGDVAEQLEKPSIKKEE